MKLSRIVVLGTVLLLQACTTISFVTDPNDDRTTYSEWHHNWLFGLIEGSDAVDMDQRCRGAGWRTISTEETFLQGFVAGLTRSIYTPHNVEYRCMKTAQNGAPAAPAKKPSSR